MFVCLIDCLCVCCLVLFCLIAGLLCVAMICFALVCVDCVLFLLVWLVFELLPVVNCFVGVFA